MSQRHELETHLEQAVRLQSPIHRLPNELLASIFVLGVLGIRDENPVMVPTLMLVWSVVCHYPLSLYQLIAFHERRAVIIGKKWF